jgi:WhiB family transcriptional regulator, redox-sensing transcriptional regulator
MRRLPELALREVGMNGPQRGSGTAVVAIGPVYLVKDSPMTIATGRDADWRSAGACLRADPDIFFPVSASGRAVREAKRICAGCEVRWQCLEFAQKNDLAYGIWGGATPEDRRRARRRSQRAARARARFSAG